MPTPVPELSSFIAQASFVSWQITIDVTGFEDVSVTMGVNVYGQFVNDMRDGTSSVVQAAMAGKSVVHHHGEFSQWVTRCSYAASASGGGLVHAMTLLCSPHLVPQVAPPPRPRYVKRLEHLLRDAPAAIAMLHVDGENLVYRFANVAFEKLVGEHDLEGKPLGAVFPELAKHNPELIQKLYGVARSGQSQQAKEFAVSLDWYRDGHTCEKYFDVVCEPVFGDAKKVEGVTFFAYDVSPLVASRHEAQESEGLFRYLADCLPQIVWTADPEGQFAYFNARWFAYCGLAPSDPAHRDWLSMLHPDDVAIGQSAWADAIRERTPLDVEVRMRSREGIYRWFLVKGLPVFGASGEVSCWFGSSTDVHEHKSNAYKIQQMLENMNEGYVSLDKNWTILQVNVRHEIMTRRPRIDQIGRNYMDLFFPEGRYDDGVAIKRLKKTMTERTKASFEFFYSPIDLRVVVNLYPNDAGGLTIFYRDNKQEYALRKSIEAEKNKFEAIFVDSPASMALLRGRELIFEKVNRSYISLIGHRDIVGKPLLDALPELTGKPFLGLLQHVLATGIPFIANEASVYLVRRRGGQPEERFLNFTYTRVLDGDKNPYGVYIHADDVSEKVKSRQRVDKLNTNLQNAIRARDDFLSSASHELKTPLTSIKMQLQMTRRHVKVVEQTVPPAPKLAKTLDQCCRQVDRLTALIEDLLDVSRIEAGKMTFNFSPTDMVALMQECLAQFADQFQAAKCEVDAQFPEHLVIVCDSFRVEQVMINLLSNAIKYAAGSVITIRIRPGACAGACITVSDRGMGIALDKIDKIFCRFERAISHKNVSGLGLGLYICREIVSAHRGKIQVRSVLNQGSTFTVDLPQDPRTEA